ncbi:hypothetical protein [Microcoleus sp. bin38.metabat.b11b12b14.051]|uniref:hypothetical protein n=1 Tax=Microcoleus sp. bin38.metabat.b11b12b14.051 TaxID=2742709 RepID=UPI0025D9DD4E|nr:hypothetical protein [Microcoleus sp. bin38.metabat.b11b12b14.051]
MSSFFNISVKFDRIYCTLSSNGAAGGSLTPGPKRFVVRTSVRNRLRTEVRTTNARRVAGECRLDLCEPAALSNQLDVLGCVSTAQARFFKLE